jgi:hypothetical protein
MTDKKSLDVNKKIARTAILLALTAAIQVAGRFLTPFMGPANMFVVGTLVNACLLIAVYYAGIWGATVISFAVPFTALLSGAPVPLPFIPFIGAGNFLLVLFFYLLKQNIPGIIVGAILKSAFLFASILIFVKVSGVPAKLAGVLYFLFSWPQVVTALLGGGVFLAAKRVLKIQRAAV